ncbi:NAD(P)/FAD-dependent oxidoreductase [uncultured Brachyspira sp.]|uniref:phytoene desaturase family protein n=1 Tax=uncultured Brachyspira sp. TaxID=221953 RepID=UPI002631175F|nr:NAD(P)/FAD-dependent oxidoreductase [uncultured Brachyspira sp.]
MTNNKYDIVIIGSGLGGLTSGAYLAKQGKKVLVLESHNIVGGCATVYKRKNVKFEVGLHELDMAKKNREMKHVIFSKLGLYDRVNLVQLPQTWRIKTESTDLTIPEGYENVINTLEKEFPEEKAGIKKYFAGLSRMMYMIRRVPYDLKFWDFFFFPVTTFPMILYQLFTQKNTGDVLDSIIKSDKLKRILNINITYYHQNPYEFTWYYHACAQGAYYNSAYFVKGGSQNLSNALADIIKENGGEIRVSSEVKKINVKGNIAEGVTYFDKRAKQEVTVNADYIIANAAPQIVYDELLPKGYEDNRIKKLKNSVSLYTVYIIFKKKFSELYPNNAYSTFITTEKTLNTKFKEDAKGQRGIPVEDRNFVFVDYSAIDSGLVEEGDNRSFAVLTGPSFLDEWKDLSDEEYKARKKEMAEKLIDRAEQHYPGFRDNIEYYEVATPKTIKRYIKTPDGTPYGFVQDTYLKKSRCVRVSPTVKNLHFASAWNFPGGGFTGALLSGYLAARNILFPLKPYIVLRLLLSIAVGTAIGTAYQWIPALMSLFK